MEIQSVTIIGPFHGVPIGKLVLGFMNSAPLLAAK